MKKKKFGSDPVVLKNDHFKEVCRIGKKAKCCKFLVLTGGQLVCVKRSHFHEEVLGRKVSAKGNNCSGPPDFKQKHN